MKTIANLPCVHCSKTFLSGILILALVSFAVSTATAQGFTNQDISQAIETELFLSEQVPSHLIDVNINKGIVTLSGTVNTIIASQKAANIAETIKGVRAVVNEIEVNPVKISDTELEQNVEDALLFDPATDSYEIDVSVSNGKVTLDGTVESWHEKQLSTKVAKGVAGVKEVTNDISINYVDDRHDYEIKADIERQLKADVWVDERFITVEVDDGEVELSGSVGSAAQKSRAAADAWVNGTRSVTTEDLTVEWESNKREEAYADISDQQIQQSLKDAFLYDPRVNYFEVLATVDDGVVTLHGVVDNLKAKKAAAEDARNTIGVWNVKNHIKVRPTVIPEDDVLVTRVKNALSRSPLVDMADIEVSAVNGLVNLEGQVNTQYEKAVAEDVVSMVNGVVEINNFIDYQYDWVWKSDINIMEDVKDRIFWNTYADLNEINVEVDNGIVTLTGQVDSWVEWIEAEESAYEAGAKSVDNNLTLDLVPYSFTTP